MASRVKGLLGPEHELPDEMRSRIACPWGPGSNGTINRLKVSIVSERRVPPAVPHNPTRAQVWARNAGYLTPRLTVRNLAATGVSFGNVG